MADRVKVMQIRRDDVCASCDEPLAAGSTAEWNATARVVTCLPCVEARANDPTTHENTPEPPAVDIDRGVPGASARERYERLHDKRGHHVKRALGKRLGGLYLALSDEPQSTRAWAVGGRGERLLGEQLETLHDPASVFVLHDRRIPKSRANIDHLAVTASGVHVIDAKNYEGKVQAVDRGGWFSTDMRLMVGRRDCTKLIASMHRQVEVVRSVLGDDTVPLHGNLCFVDADWNWFAKPIVLDNVWVGWVRALGKRLQADGTLSGGQIQQLGARLAERLPAA